MNLPQLLKKRYEVGAMLGRGGMGTVCRCRDIKTGAEHAVKFLGLEQALAKEGPRRFKHESRLLAELKHPGIIGIIDYGVESGIPYLIMELCINEAGIPYTLKQLQADSPNRRIPAKQIVSIILELVPAIAMLHEQGIVHRDLKPDNILLQTDRRKRLHPKLTDFGLVTLTRDEEQVRKYDLSISLSGQQNLGENVAWIGTYEYMSPEQRNNEPLDSASDVYSLGLIMYKMATGYERLNPELPSEVSKGLPAWFDEVVEKALAEKREDRLASASTVWELIQKRIKNPTRGDSLSGSVGHMPFHADQSGNTVRRRRGIRPKPMTWRSRAAWAACLLLVLAVGVVTAWASLTTDGGKFACTAIQRALPAPLATKGLGVFARRHRIESVRATAATKLGSVPGAPAAKTLSMLVCAPSQTVRRSALHALATRKDSAGRDARFVGAALHSPEIDIRSAAVEALASGQPDTATVLRLGSVLNDRAAPVRDAAADALTSFGATGAPGFVRGLGSRDAGIRAHSVRMLTGWHPEQAFTYTSVQLLALATALAGEEPVPRKLASVLLQSVGASALPAVFQAAADCETMPGSVEKFVRDQLRQNARPALGELLALAAHTRDSSVRSMILHMIDSLETGILEPASAELAKALAYDRLKPVMFDALTRTGVQRPDVVSALRVEARAKQPARRIIVARLLAGGDQSAVSLMTTLTADEDAEVRCVVARSWAQIKTPEAPRQRALATLLSDVSPKVRLAAVQVAAKHARTAAALTSRLVGMAARDESAPVKEAAADAIRLLGATHALRNAVEAELSVTGDELARQSVLTLCRDLGALVSDNAPSIAHCLLVTDQTTRRSAETAMDAVQGWQRLDVATIIARLAVGADPALSQRAERILAKHGSASTPHITEALPFVDAAGRIRLSKIANALDGQATASLTEYNAAVKARQNAEELSGHIENSGGDTLDKLRWEGILRQRQAAANAMQKGQFAQAAMIWNDVASKCAPLLVALRAKQEMAEARTLAGQRHWGQAIRVLDKIDLDDFPDDALIRRAGKAVARMRQTATERRPRVLIESKMRVREIRGAIITFAGKIQEQRTPAILPVQRGQSYTIRVALPLAKGIWHRPHEQIYRTQEDGLKELTFNLPPVPLPDLRPDTKTSHTSLAKLAGKAWARARARQKNAADSFGLPVAVTSAHVGIRMRLIPPDQRNPVPMYVGVTEVTQEQWTNVMGGNPSAFSRMGPQTPVESVTWIDCHRFASRLCEIEGVAPGIYRLLTDAEWETACASGLEGVQFHTGDGADALAKAGWFAGNSEGHTTTVGQLLPNAWGLYDLHGNVAEWCQPTARTWSAKQLVQAEGQRFNVHGGSFADKADRCQRNRSVPVPATQATPQVGFRICRVLLPENRR